MSSLNFFPSWILQLLCWLHLEVEFRVGDSYPDKSVSIVSRILLHSWLLSHFLSRDRSLTNFYKYPFWINFSILSLRVMQSLVLWPTTWWYRHYLDLSGLGEGRCLADSWINSVLQASSSTWPQLFVNGVYWLNVDWGDLSAQDFPWLQSISIFTSQSVGFFEDSPHTFSLNLVISSIWMNPTSLALNSSNVASDFLHKLFEKVPDFNAIII